jgi:transcriptional regulator with PAS, ATPase and Fis domain
MQVYPFASERSTSAATGKPCLFVFESNVKVLNYLKRSFSETYDLRLFSDEAAFQHDLDAVRRPSLVLLAWDGGLSFVRSSQRMRQVEAQAKLVAKSDIPVLILGESGTGKEVIANYTHQMSRRAGKMFLKVNCAAMPADLLESELFGYEQGAFTGAVKSKPGKFEICDGGTIFLDEIGEMPATLQAKLLHVLQDGTFSRLGSRGPSRTDVRIIAATNVNMKEAMARKTFREDLYYRLNGLSINLPPLRERLEEIPALVEYFMRKGARKYELDPMPVSGNLIDALTNYQWPGNLRELENIINRFLILQDEKTVIGELEGNRATPTFANSNDHTQAGGLKRLVRGIKGETESSVIAGVLEEVGWNRKAAASDLKISYKALLYKIKQYELTPNNTRSM